MYRIIIVAIALLCCAPLAYAADPPGWTYDADENGQEDWFTLSKENIICETGKQQSPVKIAYTDITALPALDVRYNDSEVTMQARDSTLLVSFPDDINSVTIDKEKYSLKEIRFHSPAEHILHGEPYPVEIQFYHQNKKGQILAISVFVRKGKANKGLQAMLDKAPDRNGKLTTHTTLNPALLMPAIGAYVAYTGSLTIPPCTEGVEWRILKAPLTMSQEQLVALVKFTQRNARLPQPTYMRKFLEKE